MDPDRPVRPTPDGRPMDDQPAWRREFPIDWPDDEYRSRRGFAKLLALTSLAFVAGQAWIGVLSLLRRARGAPPRKEIATLAELPPGGFKLFQYPRADDACVLVRLDDGRLLAYGQKCTHLSCPVLPRPAEGRFRCPCHEGSFDLGTGRPLSGPPRRPLPRVRLAVEDGRVFATGIEEGVV